MDGNQYRTTDILLLLFAIVFILLEGFSSSPTWFSSFEILGILISLFVLFRELYHLTTWAIHQ